MNTPRGSASPSHEFNVLDVLGHMPWMWLEVLISGDDACGACGCCLTPDLASTASKDHLICYSSSCQALLVPNKDLHISLSTSHLSFLKPGRFESWLSLLSTHLNLHIHSWAYQWHIYMVKSLIQVAMMESYLATRNSRSLTNHEALGAKIVQHSQQSPVSNTLAALAECMPARILFWHLIILRSMVCSTVTGFTQDVSPCLLFLIATMHGQQAQFLSVIKIPDFGSMPVAVTRLSYATKRTAISWFSCMWPRWLCCHTDIKTRLSISMQHKLHASVLVWTDPFRGSVSPFHAWMVTSWLQKGFTQMSLGKKPVTRF